MNSVKQLCFIKSKLYNINDINIVETSNKFKNRTNTLIVSYNVPVIHIELDGKLNCIEDMQDCVSNELLRHSEFLSDCMITYELKNLYKATILQRGVYLTFSDAMELLVEYLYTRYTNPIVIMDYSNNECISTEVKSEIKKFFNAVNKNAKLMASIVVYNK